LERLRRLGGGLVRLLHGLGRLRRHVVFVVLGEHLARAEHAVCAQLPLRNHALALAEQVRQRAAVDHGDGFRRVGDHEAHLHAFALHAALLHHAADAESAPLRRLVGGDLRGREEEHQVLLEGGEHQRRGDAQRREAGRDGDETLVTRFHVVLLRARRARSQISSAMASAITP
jgi:hypothetical protein